MKKFWFAGLMFFALCSFATNAAPSVQRPNANTVESFQVIFAQAHDDSHACAAYMGQFTDLPTVEGAANVDKTCARMFLALGILLEADRTIAEQVINTEQELKEFTEIVSTMEVVHKLVMQLGIQYFPYIAAVALDIEAHKATII